MLFVNVDIFWDYKIEGSQFWYDVLCIGDWGVVIGESDLQFYLLEVFNFSQWLISLLKKDKMRKL